MSTGLFEQIGIPIDYVVIGIAGLALILLILLICTMAKQSKMKKAYNAFMAGKEGRSLEDALMARADTIDGHGEAISDIYAKIKNIDNNLLITYQKIGFIKYDAFKDSGGKMSFILVLLNKENDGIMLNCMHSNTEGCYTYAKRIERGTCKIALSNEETAALNQAMGI